jgi:Ran GTPase-activating protein (RanGAP) involved in mRNA processing and transport
LGSLASSCSESLRELHIQDNKGVNQAVPQLVELLEKCKNLEILNISDLKMKKSKAIIVRDALVKTLQNGSSLKELLWNYDLACSQTTAKSVAQEISQIENSKLTKLEMVGTFQLQENR